MILDSPTVSRFHAQVEKVRQRFRVRDLRSPNGTFVNGERNETDTWLRPNDTIRIGQSRFVVGAEQLAQFDGSGGLRVEDCWLSPGYQRLPSPKRLPPTPTPDTPDVLITNITLDGSTYVVDYEIHNYPDSPQLNVHMFFNAAPPDQAGRPGSGTWKLTWWPTRTIRSAKAPGIASICQRISTVTSLDSHLNFLGNFLDGS